ncbi:hypothetical protein FB451DRAFT_1558398 [Mycena latifolia]|nr:hypothetical protein FB451DRAFT_1558398 [Mycena latifolia]
MPVDPIPATLSQSNEPLSDPQALHVQQILDDTLTTLSDIEEEISTTLLSLLKLESDRRARSKYAATLKGVLSPMRRIPSEILAEIFLHCRNNSLEAPTYSVADSRQAPIVLGHVSSRWRQVAHNSPRLWDQFHIQWERGFFSRSQSVTLLHQILARSRILPLYVELEMRGSVLPNGYAAGDVLDMLFQQAHRLTDVRLNLAAMQLPPRLFTKRTLPILSLVDIVGDQELDIPHVLTLFSDAPQLRTVYLTADSTSTHSLISAFPWSQLTHLVLDLPIGLHQARDILMQCEMMKDCVLRDLVESDDLGPSHHSDYGRLHLHSFVFSIEEGSPPETFFHVFSFPNLQNLEVRADDLPPNMLPNLYDRSRFRLTRLELDLISLRPEHLIQSLRLLPGLRVLGLSNCLEDALLKVFIYDPEEPLPLFSLQQLQSLTVAGNNWGLSGACLLDMVDSVCAYPGRQNAAFPALTVLRLFLLGSRFDEEVEARLAAACATGRVLDTRARD